MTHQFNHVTTKSIQQYPPGILDADGTTMSSGACWNQSNGLTFSFFVGGKIQWTCFSMTYGVSTMVGYGSTCTDPWPMWPIQKSDPFDPLTHDPSTHCLLWCACVIPERNTVNDDRYWVCPAPRQHDHCQNCFTTVSRLIIRLSSRDRTIDLTMHPLWCKKLNHCYILNSNT